MPTWLLSPTALPQVEPREAFELPWRSLTEAARCFVQPPAAPPAAARAQPAMSTLVLLGVIGQVGFCSPVLKADGQIGWTVVLLVEHQLHRQMSWVRTGTHGTDAFHLSMQTPATICPYAGLLERGAAGLAAHPPGV